ncbi:MAG: hypothetical protein GXO21_02195, partial [Aquificae bacterium]|nr:hypothetical protein [Aquificota bacterium]
MKTKNKFIFIFPVLALISIIGLFYFNLWTKEFFRNSEEILSKFKDLQVLEYSVDTEIIKSNFYLYYDYDVIYDKIEKLKETVAYLDSFQHLKSSTYHKTSYKYFLKYKDYLDIKEENLI